MEDRTGCSDCDLVENCSEFSSTPNTSVRTTPESSPIKKRRVEEPVTPRSSDPKRPRGKDLSLLMATQGGNCSMPKDSLYFREKRMVKMKKTAHKGTGKRPRENLASKNPRKTLTKEQVRKNALKASQAARKNLGNPQGTGGLK